MAIKNSNKNKYFGGNLNVKLYHAYLTARLSAGVVAGWRLPHWMSAEPCGILRLSISCPLAGRNEPKHE